MSQYVEPFNVEIYNSLKKEIPVNFLWFVINRYGKNIYKYWNVLAYDFEDMFQEGAIEYLLAKKSYDSTKGMTLNSWFRRRFKGKISNIKNIAYEIKRGGSRKNKSVIEYRRLYDEEDNQMKDYGFEEQLIEDLHTKELANKIKIIRLKLTKRQNIILDHWLSGLNRRESAEILGVVEDSITRMRRKIVKIAQEINNNIPIEEEIKNNYSEEALLQITESHNINSKMIDDLTNNQKMILYNWLEGISNSQSAKIIGINVRSLERNKKKIKDIIKQISERRKEIN